MFPSNAEMETEILEFLTGSTFIFVSLLSFFLTVRACMCVNGKSARSTYAWCVCEIERKCKFSACV